MMYMFQAIALSALVGFVSANSYSIRCMNTLMTIGQDPSARMCLKPTQLLPVLVGSGNGPESIIGYLDTWLGNMCSAPACSDDTLAAVFQNLTNGCSDEFGLQTTQMQQTIAAVRNGYQTIRKVVCLTDSNSEDINCVTGTLRNVEALTGSLSLNDSNLASIANYVQKGFPASVICTNCMKGAYTLLNQSLPGSFSASDTKYATDLCGAAFADGGIPPGLISTASVAIGTGSSSTSTSSPTTVTSPTPTNSAFGRHRSVLSSSAFFVISGLVAFSVGLV